MTAKMSAMEVNFKFSFFLLLVLVSSCKKSSPKNDIVENEDIEIVPLVKITSGKTFFPWGFNYTNPELIGLIEDNWDQEDTWDIIAEDFNEMRGYKANIVRIHLQYHRFMVKIAENSGLYLDITGLAAYRKSDSPEWYNSLEDSERWATHAIFWKNIAAAVGDSEAVFAFNLMNEPVVAVDCEGTSPCEWWPGNGFGGFYFVQNIARNPNLVYSTAMKDWIDLLTNAIRSEDETTMITVGFLALGSVVRFEENLDYLSIHIYPKSGEIQLSVDKVLNNQSNSPLILEEASNLLCSIEEFETFLGQIEGEYNGLMGHYFGETIEDMQNSNTFAAASRIDFIEFFKNSNPN